jgi:Protein of unknown function (DUF1549)/Protein of unknown function (DUF1553)
MKQCLLLLLLLLAMPLRAEEAVQAPHWAFQPVREPALPPVKNAAWCRTAIDRFILARLESKGSVPAPAADRRTLIRRVTFDLTGLPPTASEIEAFERDRAPDAYARLVDRLLDSSHYGEHWGRHWLDVVRYADTAGETADYPVPLAWRYRNWVIDAFNADQPYDEFLREQIAGDLLARNGPRDRYAARVTATGYLAISRRFGFDSENYHHLTIQDTIDNLGQSVLGLTLGCARCHAHKFDPISMGDYYALYGIFESTRYAFPGSEQKQRLRAMTPLVPPEESQPRWQAYEARLATLAAWLGQQKVQVPFAVLRSLDDFDGDFELQAPAAGGSRGVLVAPWRYEGSLAVTTEAQSPFKNLHPSGRVGVSVPGGTHAYRLTQRLPSLRGRQVGHTLHVNLDFLVATNDPGASGAHRFWLGESSNRSGESGGSGLEILLTRDAVAWNAGISSQTLALPRPGAWNNLQFTFDRAAGTVRGSVGVPGDVVPFAPRPWDLAGNAHLEWVVIEPDRTNGSGLPALLLDNLGVQEAPVPAVSSTPPTPMANGAGEFEAAASRRELESLLVDGPMDLAYAVSDGTPHNARLQERGDPERPSREVTRGFPEVLGGGPLPPGTTGSGRLELASWLTDPSNPLTARVMVNRIWQYHFGQGLVKTPNDFGVRGQRPTDPELLDYLATQFVRSGWSVKAMHRRILLSATYRQQSGREEARAGELLPGSASQIGPSDDCPVAPGGRAGDRRQTRLSSDGEDTDDFSPFSRRRLGAEEIRDAILQVSGELDPTPGRQHPFPVPTSWGFTQHGPFSAVYDHHQRSVYLMTQRIQRHPFLALFDGADPNASTAPRRATTVPTQALFFLNDPFVHAQAARLAARVLADAGDTAHAIRTVYREILGRVPDAHEKAEAEEFLIAYRDAWGTMGPESPEQAALAALVRVLIGSNEFLTID